MNLPSKVLSKRNERKVAQNKANNHSVSLGCSSTWNLTLLRHYRKHSPRSSVQSKIGTNIKSIAVVYGFNDKYFIVDRFTRSNISTVESKRFSMGCQVIIKLTRREGSMRKVVHNLGDEEDR